MRNAFCDLHPSVCFAFFLMALLFTMILIHPAYLAVTLVAAFACHASLRGIAASARMLLRLLPVFILLSVINPVFNRYGQTVLFTYFGRNYTLEALYYGMAIGTMFVSVLIWFDCYGVVMTSDKFIALFGSRMPSLSLLLVMVFRLVPSYQRRAKQIIGARGGIGHGAQSVATRRERVLGGMTVLSALTGWALESAVATADAMRSRGYGTAKRTAFQIYRFNARDIAVFAAILLFGGGAAAYALCGAAQAEYTPDFQIVHVRAIGILCYGLLLFFPSIINLWENIRWHISISKI